MSIEENASYGFVKLYRSLKKHWLWKDPQKLRWWIDLLLEVNHSDEKVLIGNELIECKKGQSVKSMETWAKEWKTSRGTVKRFLDLLEQDGMIKVEILKKTSRITLCNYEGYSEWRTGDGQDTDRTRTGNGHQTDTNKNGKNDNNGKNTVAKATEGKQKESYGFLVKDILQVCKFIRENKPRFPEPYIDLWNMFSDSRLDGTRKVQAINDERRRKIRTRTGEPRFDIEKILSQAKDCSFLINDWPGFDFDWIIDNQKNYIKILDGKYGNNKNKEEIKKYHDESEYLKKRQESEKRINERIGGTGSTA